jgi:hypothetical protein
VKVNCIDPIIGYCHDEEAVGGLAVARLDA